jgi:sortase (surface protein transpeptidase)
MHAGALRIPLKSCATLLLVCALQSGCAAPDRPASSVQPASRSPQRAAPHPVDPDVARFRSARRFEFIRRPASITVPAIGVSSPLVALGRNDDGTIEVPQEWQVAGWYEEGARPGAPGPAIILGHVDSRAGPAVFYRLRELGPGDEILVEQRGGRTVRFVVDRVEQHDKSAFPTESVYFPTLHPTLRLVTCGGVFDHSTGHYRDNIIVYADLARRPG